jgi:4-hydroxythreonine-4-phosphate dehydrogenase
MMLAGKRLRVSFVTSHLSLAQVSAHLSVEKILNVISITHDALVRLGIPSPKLVVAALNPHAGEANAFGTEETQIIIPAIKVAQAEGYSVEGPLPADTLFVKAKEQRWDAVVAMYHDQGAIPIKLMEFGHIVNVTLGLPIIRTSVDHGTAFDIAGQGIASESSLIAALKFAARLARREGDKKIKKN